VSEGSSLFNLNTRQNNITKTTLVDEKWLY